MREVESSLSPQPEGDDVPSLDLASLPQLEEAKPASPLRTVDRALRLPHNITALEESLLQSPVLKRLDEVAQATGMRFTHRGARFNYSRYEHSAAVLATTAEIVERLKLDWETQELARVAALLHDTGHPFFAHSGEKVIGTYIPDFDHDEVVLELLESGPIAEMVDNGGIKARDVKHVLDDSLTADNFEERGLSEDEWKRIDTVRFLVKEAGDRLTYLEMDFDCTNFSDATKEWVHDAIERFEQALVIEDGQVFVNDPQAAIDILEARRLLFKEYSAHPMATATTEILIQATRDAVDSGVFELDSLPTLVDADVLEQMDQKYYDWLEQGTDNSMVPIGVWRVSDLNDYGRSTAENHMLRKLIRSALTPITGAKEFTFVGVTPNYSKSLDRVQDPHTGDQIKVSAYVSDHDRFLTVVVPRDLTPEVKLQAYDTLHHLAELFLKEGAADLTDIAFGDVTNFPN